MYPSHGGHPAVTANPRSLCTHRTWFWPALLGGILIAAGGGAFAVQKIRKGGGILSLGEKGALAAAPHTAV